MNQEIVLYFLGGALLGLAFFQVYKAGIRAGVRTTLIYLEIQSREAARQQKIKDLYGDTTQQSSKL